MELARPCRRLLRVLLCLLPLLVASCSQGGWKTSGLLADAQLQQAQGISHPERLTDGIASPEGDDWRSEYTARFGRSAILVWDLGEQRSVRAAWINGDNNDQFTLEGSVDGEQYSEIWTAPSVRAPGLRDRSVDSLEARARYIRLSALSRDNKVSASELMLFEQRPKSWPPIPKRMQGGASGERLEFWLWMLGIASALFVLLMDRRLPDAVLALAIVPAAILVWLLQSFANAAWVPTEGQLNVSRAVAALIGVAVALRKSPWLSGSARFRPVSWMLGSAALLSVLTFYNWGTPQFADQRVQDGRTYVHTWDMRVYFPQAKYFEELGFDGLYLASTLAHLEDPKVSEAKLVDTRLRDLRDYRVVRVGEISKEIHAIKSRFSPERWQAFKLDMNWFRATMGSAYLQSMLDHGGNATPVWLSVARVMFKYAPANETTLLLAGLIDPLLLLLLFVAIGRSYDWPTALSCLIIFGATTVTFLGSNWGGSTLRHDWMIATGLAVCAFKVQRPVLAGVLLAYATLIRVIPALPALSILVPVVWWAFERWRATGRVPSFRELARAHRGVWRCVLGAAVCALCLVGASTADLGLEAGWGKWFEKIQLHSDKHTPNRVGLKTIFSYAPGQHKSTEEDPAHPAWTPWMVSQYKTFQSRRWLFRLVSVSFVVLAFAAARRRGTDVAVLLGVSLIPVVFYVSNYYHHIVFLIPLLASESLRREKGALWLTIHLALLGFCLHNYWSIGGHWGYVRFLRESWGLIGCYAIIWSALAAGWPSNVGVWLNREVAPKLPRWILAREVLTG